MLALGSATPGVSPSPPRCAQDSCSGGFPGVAQCTMAGHSIRVAGQRAPSSTAKMSDIHSLFRKRLHMALASWQLKGSVSEIHTLRATESSFMEPAMEAGASLALQRKRDGLTLNPPLRGLAQAALATGGKEGIGGAPSCERRLMVGRGRSQRLGVPGAVDAQRPAASEEFAIASDDSDEDDDDDMDTMSSRAMMIPPLPGEADEWRPMGTAADKLAESGDNEAGSPWLMMMPGGGPMSDGELQLAREAGSMTYQAARRLLGSLADTMESLEENLIKREQELALTATQISDILLQGPASGDRVSTSEGTEGRSGDSSLELREAESRIRKLGARVAALQRDVETKDEAIAGILKENKTLKQKLMEGEEASADVRKLRREIESRDKRLAVLASDTSLGKRTQEERSRIQEALQAAELQASQLRAEVAQMAKDLELRDTLLDQMRTEAQLSSKALTMAAAAMAAGREKATALESQVRMASEERDAKRSALDETQAKLKDAAQREEELQRLREVLQDTQRALSTVREENVKKDQMITMARREVAKSAEMLEISKKALQKAEEQAEALEAQVDKGQEALREEVEASSKALKSAAKREQVLRMAEAKVRELTAELTSVRAVMDAKERTLDAVREEILRNADMLMSAANTREALAAAEKQVEMLTSHMEALEREIQSRDQLFEEIRSETFRSTEALKMATLIKQELNASREREAELQQLLEEKCELIEDLRQESAESSRTSQGAQALRAAEEAVEMLRFENETMRRGIETRDEAINIMKEELDRSVDMLDHASHDRDALQTAHLQLAELESELLAKDTRLRLLQEELASALNISPSGIRMDDGGRKPFAPWRPNQHLRADHGRSSSPSPQRPSPESKHQ